MSKKPSVLISSYSNLHCLYCHYVTSTNTSIPSLKSHRSKHSRPRQPPFRNFAETHSDNLRAALPKGPSWPDLPSPSAVPTPYQILRLKKDSPYSKRRFYELVKIYHPDKNYSESGSSDTDILPRSTKTQRYYLIVTAHDILSDPVKRKAYDKYGAGWEGRPEHGAPKSNWGRSNDAKWSGFDTNDSPFRNATWEDWEKWYQRDTVKQEPLYFSNVGFLMLVLAAVSLAGFGQSIRVENYSNNFQKQLEKGHDDASMAIRQRRTESQGFGNRDERLQNFLKTRDPDGYGVIDPTEESYQDLLRHDPQDSNS